MLKSSFDAAKVQKYNEKEDCLGIFPSQFRENPLHMSVFCCSFAA